MDAQHVGLVSLETHVSLMSVVFKTRMYADDTTSTSAAEDYSCHNIFLIPTVVMDTVI